MRRLSLALCFVFVFGGNSLAIATETVRPFAAADSIEMTHLADPDSGADGALVKMSPDRRYFAAVTRKGNLKTGENDYELLLFKSEDTLEFVRGGRSTRPAGTVLARLSSASNEPAIKNMQWLADSKGLAFIGASGKAAAQVYRVDIRRGKLTKLTDHDSDVQSFAVGSTRKDVLYTAANAPVNLELQQPSFVVGVRTIHDLVRPEVMQQLWPKRQFFIKESGKPARALGEPFEALIAPRLWLSPDGRRAATLLPSRVAPQEWITRYERLANAFSFKRRLEAYDENHMRSDIILRQPQYFVIDTDAATTLPIFNAPSGQYAGPSIGETVWMPDSKSIILSDTFLPLDGVDDVERQRRSNVASIAEYDFATGTPRRIIDVPEYKSGDGANAVRFTGMELSADGVLTISRRTRLKKMSPLRFRKTGLEWVQVETTTEPDETATDDGIGDDLSVFIVEDLDMAPELGARDNVTGQEKVITDFNPQFRELTFGKADVMEWTDREGRGWVGGLVYPVGFEPGQRYPLVIQTHGFRADQFLVDGPYGMSSVFAAQSLANKGLMVLQAPDSGDGIGTTKELATHRAGFEAAIDVLDERGLIDRDKVGLIGFSRTGLYVEHMITFSDYKFAAATIADSISASHWGYASVFGYGMASVEGVLGGQPWGDGLDGWVERNPGLHTDRIHAPLRLESYNTFVFERWDTYAFLKRQHKPVEFIRIPGGDHNLVKPLERLASLQGNVDWFTFWLKGEEDPNPAKAEQYIRWRKLRAEHEADIRAGAVGTP